MRRQNYKKSSNDVVTENFLHEKKTAESFHPSAAFSDLIIKRTR